VRPAPPCPLCSTATEHSPVGRTPASTCPKCRLITLAEPEMPEDYYADYFDRFRGRPDDPAVVLRHRQYEVDAGHLTSLAGGGRLLDIGCSAGGFLQAVEARSVEAERADARSVAWTRFFGIDPDVSAIRRCRELRFRVPATFEVGDVLSLPADTEPFDTVVFRGTLQYVGPDLHRVLERVDRLLAPGGRVVVYALPNAGSFLFSVLADQWHLFHAKEHRLMFCPQTVEVMAREMGWRLDECSFPYLDTPYASPAEDYGRVVEMVRGGPPGPVPFWGNLLQVVLTKEAGASGAANAPLSR